MAIIVRMFGKKGFTYLLVSSLIIVVLLGIFFVSNQYKYQDQIESQSIRIRAMNDFVNNFNNDVHRATHTSAFRALISLEDNVASNGQYLSNITQAFEETFYNGTLNGTSIQLMQNSSFKDYILKVHSLAESLGMNVNATVTQITLTQPDPWSIDVHVYIVLNVSDVKNLASWYTTKDFVTNIPIYNLRDPLYGINTHNKIPNTIRQFNQTPLVSGTDTTNLKALINESYYLESSDAPSFLMRFEGKTDSSAQGIESIVNIQTISDQGIEVYSSRPKIDYIYFNNITVNKVCAVQNVPTDMNFVISVDRVNLYEISGLNYSVTPACP